MAHLGCRSRIDSFLERRFRYRHDRLRYGIDCPANIRWRSRERLLGRLLDGTHHGIPNLGRHLRIKTSRTPGSGRSRSLLFGDTRPWAAVFGGSPRKRLFRALAAVLLLVCVWTAMSEEAKARFRTIWDPASGPRNAQISAEGRTRGFWAGMRMFQTRPVTGVGIGNFTTYRQRFVDGIPMQAHNLAGQLLGETGLVGAAGFLLLIGAVFLNARRTRLAAKGAGDPRLEMLRELALASCAAVALLLFAGLVGHNLYRPIWLWIAAWSAVGARLAADLHAEAASTRYEWPAEYTE